MSVFFGYFVISLYKQGAAKKDAQYFFLFVYASAMISIGMQPTGETTALDKTQMWM